MPIFPWRIVRREHWDELVAANEDLLKQNWDLSSEVAALKKPAPRTRKRSTAADKERES